MAATNRHVVHMRVTASIPTAVVASVDASTPPSFVVCYIVLYDKNILAVAIYCIASTIPIMAHHVGPVQVACNCLGTACHAGVPLLR